jgi:hypothetical protein
MESPFVSLVNTYYERGVTEETRKEIERDLISLRAQPILAILTCNTALQSTALTQSGAVLVLSILQFALAGGWVHTVDDSVRMALYASLMAYALPPATSAVSAAASGMAGKALAYFVLGTAEATFIVTWEAILAALAANDASTTYALRLLHECLVAWLPDQSATGDLASSTIAASETVRREIRGTLTAQLPTLFGCLGTLLTQRMVVVSTNVGRLPIFDRAITEPLLSALEQLVVALPHSTYASDEFLEAFKELSLNCFSCENGLRMIGGQALSVVTVILNKQIIPAGAADVLLNLAAFAFRLLGAAIGACEPADNSLEMQIPAADSMRRFIETMDSAVHAYLMDFLKGFYRHVLPKVELTESFPLMRFFELFFHYTLCQPDPDQFVECISCWTSICERIAEQIECDSSCRLASAYEPIIEALAEQVLRRALLKHNAEILLALADDAELAELPSTCSSGAFGFLPEGALPKSIRTGTSGSGVGKTSQSIPSYPYLYPEASAEGVICEFQDEWYEVELIELATLRARTILADRSATDERLALDAGPSERSGSQREKYVKQCVYLLCSICKVAVAAEKVLQLAGLALNECIEAICECSSSSFGENNGQLPPSQEHSVEDASTLLFLMSMVGPLLVASTDRPRTDMHQGILNATNQLAREAVSRSWSLRGTAFVSLYSNTLTCLRACISAINSDVCEAIKFGSNEAVLNDSAAYINDAVCAIFTALDSTVLPSTSYLCDASINLWKTMVSYDAVRVLLRCEAYPCCVFTSFLVPADSCQLFHRVLSGIRPFHQSNLILNTLKLLLIPVNAGLQALDCACDFRLSAAQALLQPFVENVCSGCSGGEDAGQYILQDKALAARCTRALGILNFITTSFNTEQMTVKTTLASLVAPCVPAVVTLVTSLTRAAFAQPPVMARPRSPFAAPLLLAADALSFISACISSFRNFMPDSELSVWVASFVNIVQQLCSLHALDDKPQGFTAALISALRVLRQCCRSSMKGISTSAVGDPAAQQMIRSIISTVLLNDAKAAAHPGTLTSEDIAPSVIALSREFLVENWNFLSAREPGGHRAVASAESLEVIEGLLENLHVWLSNSFGSVDMYRLALLNLAALDRDCPQLLIAVERCPSSSFLSRLELTLLDNVISGERSGCTDEIVSMLLKFARYNQSQFSSEILHGWCASHASRFESTAEFQEKNLEQIAVEGLRTRLLVLLAEEPRPT